MVVRAGVSGLIFHSRLVESRAVGHVHLAADEWLDPDAAHGVVELDRPEHVAVVGDGTGRHPELCDFFCELFRPAGAVEQ